MPLIAPADGGVVLGIPIGFSVPAFETIDDQEAAGPRIEAWLKSFEQQVETFINDALADKRFDRCVRFTVDVHVKFIFGYPVSFADSMLVYEGDALVPQAGPLVDRHRILLNENPAFRSVVHSPSTTRDGTVDSAKAFEFYSTGEWAFYGMGPRDYSHEVMHLLGLGDDYRSVYGPNGEFLEAIPLPGRAGTLMDTGTEIDQELVDRLGKMLREAGLLPNCYVAEAPMVRSVVTTAGGSCSDVWRMDLTFLEAADGTAEGDGTATLVSGMSCEPPVPGQHSPSETFRFAVEGKRDGDAFALTFPLRGTGTVGVGMYAVWNFDGTPRTPLTIPTDGDRSVEARWENSFTNPDGSIVQYETSGRFTLECRSCPPAVG